MGGDFWSLDWLRESFLPESFRVFAQTNAIGSIGNIFLLPPAIWTVSHKGIAVFRVPSYKASQKWKSVSFIIQAAIVDRP